MTTDNGMRCLMEAQIRAELELTRAPTLERYRRALEGIASCATQCGCCRMHVEIAQEALATTDGE
jgi:hypothetical protein